MVEKILALDKAIEHLTNIARKTDQALRLFNELYERRLKGYQALGLRSDAKFWKNWGQEKRKTIEMLRINNQRERKIFLEIYAGVYDEMKPYLDMMERRWKKEVKDLKIMKGYFDGTAAEQKVFLDKELEFLDGKISKEDFKLIVEEYFKKVEEFSASVIQKYNKFYSPIDFQRDFADKIKKGLIKDGDKLGYIAIFVGLFSGIHNVAHALPEQFINSETLPTWTIFFEFIFICYALMKLKAPERMWAEMKDYSKKTAAAIVSIV